MIGCFLGADILNSSSCTKISPAYRWRNYIIQSFRPETPTFRGPNALNTFDRHKANSRHADERIKRVLISGLSTFIREEKI